MKRIVRSLGSGSSGNALFVRLGETRILIDAGIAGTHIVKELEKLGEDAASLDAIVITHEHHDHVRGLDVLRRRIGDVAVHATRKTRRALELDPERHLLDVRRPTTIGQVDLWPFAVEHDAADPVGLRLEGAGCTIGIATDLGYWTDPVAEHLMQCDLLVLEANHDPEMLRYGPYPGFLKRRVAGRHGHLANGQARHLLERVASSRLRHLVLAHLSETNNSPRHVRDCLEPVVAGSEVTLTVARKDGTPTLHLAPGPGDDGARQLSLF